MTFLTEAFISFLDGANFIVSIPCYIGFNFLKNQYQLNVFGNNPYFFIHSYNHYIWD